MEYRGGKKQRCRTLNAELCAAVQLLFKSMQTVLDDAWKQSARRTEELSQADDSYFCQPQSDIRGWKRSACGRWGGKQQHNHLNGRENSNSVKCKCFVLKSSEEWQNWWRCGHWFSLQRLKKWSNDPQQGIDPCSKLQDFLYERIKKHQQFQIDQVISYGTCIKANAKGVCVHEQTANSRNESKANVQASGGSAAYE